MSVRQLTILEGSVFCVCDEIGDVGGAVTEGLFAEDTRFLSRLRLTINGRAPLLLSSDRVEYFSAAFFLRNAPVGGLPHDVLSVKRERFVGEGMQDHVVVRNEGMDPVEFEVGLEVGADFADILSVKEHDFALGNPEGAAPLPQPVAPRYDEKENQFVLADPAGFGRTQLILSRRGDTDGHGMSWRVALEPREAWDLRVDVVPATDGEVNAPHTVERRFGDERTRVRESLAAWQLRIPQLRATWDDLEHAFARSVADIASLRMRTNGRLGIGKLPAAGMPWFMTVFGRDTIITCLQTLLFGPELAASALEALAGLQATEDDPSRDAEPGKIVHELRRGKAAARWFDRYYGTVDATPLYLVLLSEVWRWTEDPSLAQTLRPNALAALEWIDRWGDRDGDGFVEFEKRSEHGLDVHSWKDSFDSQRFHDGRTARPPIAPAEVQGYAYDAKRRLAELAREVWRDNALAQRLEAEATELKQRFDESFWIDDRGGYFALALDGEKQPVDSLCSNVGHLLWSGIVGDHRVDALVDRLMSDELWSGWGVRTMSSGDAAFNPLAYHNGTVWPHDNSLIAWGLARYGRWQESHRIIRSMLRATHYFDHQLPEVFAGMSRAETAFPIAYPTAARPQAWAAGTPVLLLQLLLGLQPNRRRQVLEAVAPLELPSWAGDIRLTGVRAFEHVWDVRVAEGRVRVEPA
jgi:glycogen debranching enzyme